MSYLTPEEELEFRKWYIEPYPASWKSHRVVDKINEILKAREDKDQHETQKFLDGFGHPEMCEVCKIEKGAEKFAEDFEEVMEDLSKDD